jgi:dephospho-CoA kinase
MTQPPGPRWRGGQRRIGLTGGIASGKSTVGHWLEARGLPLLDADRFAREALAAGSAGARAVLQRYGAAVQAAGSHPAEAQLDRSALGRIVFHDPSERLLLEQLVHPLVRQRFDEELQQRTAAPALVLMIPLLFEAGLEGLCSEIWLVDCDPATQLQRLMTRDQLNDADARARLGAQGPLERKRPLADLVIDNRGGPEALEPQLATALEAGLSPGASG